MPERIPPHRHCKECGKPVQLDEIFCSDKCETAFKTKLRTRRNRLYLFYMMAVLILIAAMLFLGYG